jgi:hypothetical protein
MKGFLMARWRFTGLDYARAFGKPATEDRTEGLIRFNLAEIAEIRNRLGEAEGLVRN